MKKFKIMKNPYDDATLFGADSVVINPGVTVLVGCNGAGKTTMLRMIEEQLRKRRAAYLRFDNQTEGGHGAMERYGFHEDMDRLATMFCSSEGERIMIVLGEQAGKIAKLARNNRNRDIYILFDAVDSGFSIDNICELKEFLFDTIIDDHPEDVYIICTANSYEMTVDADCIDVMNCSHISFKDYDDYREFILRTKEQKEKRPYN